MFLFLRNSTLQPEQKVSDAIQTIDGLRETLEKAYWMLSKAGYDHIHKVISELQPETVSLCELQLRGLEGLVKMFIAKSVLSNEKPCALHYLP
ncbi:hypothetical protein HV275_04905 [Enterobacter hormaechei]|uniref:hypothetical protein n=1 Tax=Enterobacter hormaechei TaxID=158836 RepID=UPI0015F85E45|nr:hypothetical protein [Enterobacter hormaechei]MBA7916635.1 hypothetical protein [Enterobacter hormaechei]